MGCSCATEERSRGCTGGNLNTDFRCSEEERCRQSFAKEGQISVKDDVTSEGPTITDLTAMVQQLRLENRCLENQLAERKIEVEELRDDLRLLRRGLSAKMKRLIEATGHKDLY
jgi:predicted RNase H-like nuclease (RuvC/YqgF family)